jgi:hypothetical protein
MAESKKQLSNDDPVATADEMSRRTPDRTLSPHADAMEGAPGRPAGVDALDGQLGPDEISEPDEVVMNQEAKQHH